VTSLGGGRDARGAERNAIDVAVESPAIFGSAHPALVLSINQAVAALQVRLSGAGGLEVAESWAELRPGAVLRVELPAARPGRYGLRGELTARFGSDEPVTMPLSFEVVSLAALAFTANATPESVEAGSLRVEAAPGTRLERYELELYGRGESPLAVEEGSVAPDGTISWSPPDAVVLRAVLTVHDDAGRYREVTLYPWRVDVPHEEVRFASGSARIPAGEAPKLEASLTALRQTLADYGRWAPAQLFIAGHTDTVGRAVDNRELSRRRAQAIGRWFREHGVEVPIFFAGFGEAALRRPTPDETEAAENRRAEYIVAVDPPPRPAGAPDWARLR